MSRTYEKKGSECATGAWPSLTSASTPSRTQHNPAQALVNRRSELSHELTQEERSKGGYARAAKIRARHDAAEQLRIERLAAGPPPRRRRRLKAKYRRAFSIPLTQPEISALKAADTATARVLLDRHRILYGDA